MMFNRGFFTFLLLLFFACSNSSSSVGVNILFLNGKQKLIPPLINSEEEPIIGTNSQLLLTATSPDGGVNFIWTLSGPGSITLEGNKATYFSTSHAGLATVYCSAKKQNYYESDISYIQILVKSTKLPTPELLSLSNGLSMTINTTKSILLTSTVEGVTYSWSIVEGGGLITGSGSQIIYTAPSNSGFVKIGCYISKDGFINSDMLILELFVTQ